MMSDFDVNAWLSQAESARAELIQREDFLRNQIKDLKGQLDKACEDRIKVEEILNVGGRQTERRPVKIIVRKVKDSLRGSTESTWSEDQIRQLVLECDPLVNPKSIPGALRQLVNEGEISREGKRGSFVYSHVANDAFTVTQSMYLQTSAP